MSDPPKRRRIQMHTAECVTYSLTEEGSKALTDPSSVPKSSCDRNSGLYPKTSPRKSASTSKFQNVYPGNSTQQQNVLNCCQPSCSQQMPNHFISSKEYFVACKNHTDKDTSKRKRNSRKYPKQKNSLLNYLSSDDKETAESFLPLVIDLSEESNDKSEHEHLQNTEKTIESEDTLNVIFEVENSVSSETSRVKKKNNESEDVLLQSLLEEEIKTKEMLSSTVEDKSDLSNNAEDSTDYDIYGLLGTGNIISTCEVYDGPDYFEMLPTDIFELILCHLPFLDLMLNLKRVAKYWNKIISNEKFLFWKKKYFKLKANKTRSACSEIQAICLSLDMDTIRHCLHGLIKYMKEFSVTPAPDMQQNLKWHSKYTWAEDLIKHTAADCIRGGVPNPWCVVAALVIISETMWDVYNIFKCLIHSASQCPIPDILECLYCIATFLYYFKENHKINHGLHYRVYYAIYTYENQGKGKTDDVRALHEKVNGQQSILRYSSPASIRLTHEQMHIVNHQLKSGQIVKIVAFAGTGKTSTLIEYTMLHPHLKFLNVMYNKSVCDHAKTCFPSNVECRTAHSLAWTAVGNRYLRKLSFNVKPLDIMPLLKTLPKGIGQRYQYASLVLTTVQDFMTTADELITTSHAPISVIEEGEPRSLEHEERMKIVHDAEHLWNQMIDLNSPARIVHDVYLKLYQLSNPDLSKFDCILVDEAQDCNGAMLSIILSQPRPKILVGDPHQQIYSFRGATNALDRVNSTHTYYLTQSFRFGPEVAYVASCALEVLKKVSNKTLVGGTHSGSVLGKKEGQMAIITRTNLTLFNEAVRLCCTANRRSEEPSSVFGCFAGGIKGYNLDQIADIQKLMSCGTNIETNENLKIKDRFIKRFSSFDSLHKYAQSVKDADLLGKIKLVLQHHEKIPEYVETIKRKCSYSLNLANIVFTTAHKAKGLEFDTVSIADDFTVGSVPYPSGDINLRSMLEEEFNLLYVAITRAKKCVCISTSIYYMLLGAQEKFEYLISRKVLDESEETTFKCFACGQDVLTNNKNPLVLARRKLTFSNDRTLPGGLMCTKCATYPVFVPVFANSNFAVQMTRPLEDFAHESISQLVGPLLSNADIEKEESRKSPLLRNNPYIALHDENFGDNIFFLI